MWMVMGQGTGTARAMRCPQSAQTGPPHDGQSGAVIWASRMVTQSAHRPCSGGVEMNPAPQSLQRLSREPTARPGCRIASSPRGPENERSADLEVAAMRRLRAAYRRRLGAATPRICLTS